MRDSTGENTQWKLPASSSSARREYFKVPATPPLRPDITPIPLGAILLLPRHHHSRGRRRFPLPPLDASSSSSPPPLLTHPPRPRLNSESKIKYLAAVNTVARSFLGSQDRRQHRRHHRRRSFSLTPARSMPPRWWEVCFFEIIELTRR